MTADPRTFEGVEGDLNGAPMRAARSPSVGPEARHWLDEDERQVGFASPAVVAAIEAQLDELSFCSRRVHSTAPRGRGCVIRATRCSRKVTGCPIPIS